MRKKEVDDFLRDTASYDIFSYEHYKKASMQTRLKIIGLLNEYYRLMYGEELPKLPVDIDHDGVILDTINYSKKMLLEQYGIDYDKHDRSNVEADRKVGMIFHNLDWFMVMKNAKELNQSKSFIRLIKDSPLYDPAIHSIASSPKEVEIKNIILEEELPGVKRKVLHTKSPKQCSDDSSVLIDDDDYYLRNWRGKPIHFAGRKTIFPEITDLGEIYYLFLRDSQNPDRFVVRQGLYDGYEQVEEGEPKRLIWRMK